MIAVTLPETVDDLLTRIYVVATSIDTKGHSSSLVKNRLRGLQYDLHEAIQQLERDGFQDEQEPAYYALFDVLAFLTMALRSPGVRRDSLQRTVDAIGVVRQITLPY